jgi:Glyoxalase superfamily protein/Clp amino terminal domain, pathogenicity island component
VNVSQVFIAFARTTGQQRKHWHPCFVQAKDQDMRDFRDTKAMARSLRAALAAKGLNITISQSLELIAKAFGVADWNTLAAAIRRGAPAPRNDASPSPPPTGGSIPHFSGELESTLHRALADANHREHEYATLEHLLLALIDDSDASAVMKACNVALGALKKNLANYVDNELSGLANPDGDDARPTSAFQRVIQRAVIHVQSSGREEVTGANVLVAMFAETESPAVSLLGEQDMTRQDALNFMVHGIVKASGDAVARRPRWRRSPITPEADEKGKRGVEPGVARQSFSHRRTKPVVVEKIKRRIARSADRKTGKNAK